MEVETVAMFGKKSVPYLNAAIFVAFLLSHLTLKFSLLLRLVSFSIFISRQVCGLGFAFVRLDHAIEVSNLPQAFLHTKTS